MINFANDYSLDLFHPQKFGLSDRASEHQYSFLLLQKPELKISNKQLLLRQKIFRVMMSKRTKQSFNSNLNIESTETSASERMIGQV